MKGDIYLHAYLHTCTAVFAEKEQKKERNRQEEHERQKRRGD